MDIENLTEDEAFESEERSAEEETEDIYKHVFKKKFEYEGKTYTELTFDFAGLTGRVALEIERELSAVGKSVVVPAFNSEYLIRMASKACNEPIGADAFEIMQYADYVKITNKARNFILRSER